MPLGLMPEMSYEEKDVDLREGDSVLFYSDGLVEAHDHHYEMFGFPLGWERSSRSTARNDRWWTPF